ncbi:hypothetical protein [Vibrio sagamiensis]|uniref:DUF2846 domain-containing protein n=1 Tax=Vibrio sagamiensis NBRC 104589 TaxID=1219064 RepID=A0A511QK96_9VIBR|nr:hypothetical protein [Vibrio sagamiensis]PNQ69324.1 hypothetical protein C1141_06340 [Vibrio agarivorans]GEM77744.1 hypothetical protein VSA01S_38560 [Vibrio sagamiensis NBRC 104589]
MKKVLLLSLLTVLTACASGPNPKQMSEAIKDFKLESESSGDIVDIYIYYLHAKDKTIFGDVAYTLDGQKEYIAKLFYGEYVHFQVSPGQHTISWRGKGKKTGTMAGDSLTMNFEKEKTYIFRQVHKTIFNLYADDGLSTISSLTLAKDMISGKYYLSKTKKTSVTEKCVNVREVLLLPMLCG